MMFPERTINHRKAIIAVLFLLFQSNECFTTPSLANTKRPAARFLQALPEWVDDSMVESAKAQLLWEQLEEKQNRPVLNLSAVRRENTIEEGEQEEAVHDDDAWMDGTRWNETRFGLEENILKQSLDDENAMQLIKSAPQLMRLPSEMVLKTAQLLVTEYDFDLDTLKQQPQLLTFSSDHIKYGIQFLSTMMMIRDPEKTIQACRQSPALLLGGIEGGLQEQAVKSALGTAAEATSKANQQIASNAMKSLDMIQNKRMGNKKL